jgi:bifunctional DNase/RNase
MTHDLISNIFRELHATITRIVITDLNDNVYYALMYAKNAQGEIAIDSRPSDAIAVALRVSAPIFVEDRVMAKANGCEWEDEEDKRTRGFMEWVDKL